MREALPTARLPTPPELPKPLPAEGAPYLAVGSSAAYHALREKLARPGTFQRVEGSPWPTALIDETAARGQAQLRPAAADETPLLPPEDVEAWARQMWRHRDELSPLDADALDALAHRWLQEARHPEAAVTVDVDELLALRGLKPKQGGQGRRGGYEPEQRREMLLALAHVQNVWLTMAELDVTEEDAKGRRRRTTKQAVQSRPFVITDRMGQVRLDGSLDVQAIIFRPGVVFGLFLWGPGRQTALLSAKALHFDPYRQAPEKALTRWLSWQWRIRAKHGAYTDPYRVATLLEAAGETLDHGRPTRTRERLERTLDALQAAGIAASWQYDRWDESTTHRRGWADTWLQATVLIEPPDLIRDHYRTINHPAPAPVKPPALAAPASLAERLKVTRQRLQLSQMRATEAAGVSQKTFSRAERGDETSASPRRKLEAWLAGHVGAEPVTAHDRN